MWHEAVLLNEMNKKVPCHIITAGVSTSHAQWVEWFTWLVGLG